MFSKTKDKAIVDCKTDEETGTEVLSARGALKLTIFAFIEEPTAGKNTVNMVKQICQIIASRRYGMGSNELFKKLSTMTVDEANDWIENVWDKFIDQDDVLGLFS